MKKLTDFISKTGENPKFVAFMAHSGFAATVLMLFSGWHQYAAAVVALLLAVAKEFSFDLRYEATPPQTLMDSVEDFIGYLTGIAFALLAAHLGL
ncbi:MAG: hypothetical protein KGH65_03600 [Candidatus Micrarchaeota archaeon]|nr:hypothetical protein [Candidatus Micrarchaeota archaeon]